MRSGRDSLVALLSWGLLFSAAAFATLVPRMTLEDLVDGSRSVVHGTVTRTWTGWDGDGRMIWTHYEIQVADSLKGSPGSRIVLSEPGGMIGDTSMQIVGVPVYEVGEEIVVFTTLTPVGFERTCGWGQGKFGVSASEDGTRKVVSSGLRGVQLVERRRTQPGARSQAATSIDSLNGLALEEFKARLRNLMQARAE